ncbi:MAG: glucosamine-6-phosphate deaminase [Chloroflexi bacterium]|nr:glucosamine-6-phosphate deaminase [Chloroflexota bacterium]
MTLFVSDTAEEVARGAADDASEVIRTDKRAAVMFAVGESPTGLYAELADRRRSGTLDTSRIRAVQLDEYLGVAAEDERSFYGWLRREALDPLGIPLERTTALHGDAPDAVAECARYERAVKEGGGIDVAILGIGTNGHLGFNEPPSDATAPTRVVQLADETIESNARYWGGRERVPTRGITAGMRVILAARRIVVVVTGPLKSEILHRALEDEVTADLPASWLRTVPNVRVYCDRAAWDG